jgi:hypothetical protein
VHASEQAPVADSSTGWYRDRGRSLGGTASYVQSDRIVIGSWVNCAFGHSLQPIAAATLELRRLAMDKRLVPFSAD